ncbi:MAG: radical SAM protein [Myxococcales bacterium]
MTPSDFTLQWHLTERCNLRCAHCYQQRVCDPGEPSLAEVERVLDQFVGLLDALKLSRGRVTLTGGEPFVREDFFDVLQAVARRRERLDLAVLTNGTRVDRDVARRLAQVAPAYVQVSIEGREATHERIRGPGSFGAAVAGLEHLAACGLWSVVSFTAHRGNYREFPEVARLARQVRARRVWADRLVPEGRGAELAGDVLDPEQTRELFARMRAARPRFSFGHTEVSLHRALQFLEDGGRPYRCNAGRRLLALLPDGTLLPCRRLPMPVGNLRDGSLLSLYQSSPLLNALRGHEIARGCETCFYKSLCQGGLRCLSRALTGDPFNADPGCWRAAALGREIPSSPTCEEACA